MQTFLPLPSLGGSAAVLDRRRLGKQRGEVVQILRTLSGQSSGWASHPAVRMWRGHEQWLLMYGVACCVEWAGRGYRDATLVQLESEFRPAHLPPPVPPPWWGDPRLHASHRASLLAKAPDHYSQFGWAEKPAIDYWWPEVR